MFKEALFTKAKLWNQGQHPLTDEWIEKEWHIYIHTIVYTQQ